MFYKCTVFAGIARYGIMGRMTEHARQIITVSITVLIYVKDELHPTHDYRLTCLPESISNLWNTFFADFSGNDHSISMKFCKQNCPTTTPLNIS